MRQKNPDDTRKIPLKFIAYTYGYEKGLSVDNQFNYLKKLNEWGFKTNSFNKLITGVKNLIVNYNEIETSLLLISLSEEGKEELMNKHLKEILMKLSEKSTC